jgi:hypothetical protein
MRRRVASAGLVMLAAPLLGGAVSPGRTDPALEAEGWHAAHWDGIAPARFAARPGGVTIRAERESSFIWRRLPAERPEGASQCLSWRWRVDAGLPATDLTRRGGDDRAITLSIGFTEFGPSVSLATRAQHALAQAQAGEHKLPRSVLGYVWGGTGREPAFFPSPWLPGITRLRVLRSADAPRGTWLEERVDLAADWRAAFGPGTAVPPLREIVLAADTDDTGARLEAMVEGIRFGPCR